MDKTLDPRTFWQVMGMRAIGVAVITAKGKDGPAGFVALSTAHVTASPPTMMVSVGHKTSALPALTESGAFAINFLAKGQEGLAAEFGGRGERKGADRFDADAWTTLATGAPVLVGSAGAMDCRVKTSFDYADSTIVLGEIVDWSADAAASPLVGFRGGYL